MSRQMLRAVIVIDLEAQTLSDAAEFEVELKRRAKEMCETMVDPSNNSKDDICIRGHKAGIPLQVRRGATGSLDDIVFRGTRGPNASGSGKVKIPLAISTDEHRHLVDLREKLRRQGLSTPQIQELINEAHSGLMSGEIQPKVVRKYNKRAA